jgi:hypothetical protein
MGIWFSKSSLIVRQSWQSLELNSRPYPPSFLEPADYFFFELWTNFIDSRNHYRLKLGYGPCLVPQLTDLHLGFQLPADLSGKSGNDILYVYLIPSTSSGYCLFGPIEFLVNRQVDAPELTNHIQMNLNYLVGFFQPDNLDHVLSELLFGFTNRRLRNSKDLSNLTLRFTSPKHLI